MLTAAAVVLAALAVVVAVLARRQRRDAMLEVTTVRRDLQAAQAEVDHQQDRLAEVRYALDALDLGVLLVDVDGSTILQNAMARRSSSPIEDALVDAAIDRIRTAARSGQSLREVVRLSGPPTQVVEVTGRSLDEPWERAVLIVIADVTGRVRTDEIRRDFIANLSHELRSPLGAVTVLVDALDGEPEPLTRDRLTGRIGIELERMTAIVDDLLDLSRLEFDGAARRRPVDVAGLVGSAVEAVRHTAEARHVKLLVEVPDLGLDADEAQVVRALGNLLENAVKYSDEGTTVRLEVEDDEHLVRFYIHDEGIGIPQADLERIFERFYRVDTARSRETGGTGLGLAIVRHVAHNHGGEVLVRSREGEGSTFVLTIPRGARP